VVKNTIFEWRASSRNSLTSASTSLGPLLSFGGNNPSGVAKALGEFFKKKEKVDMRPVSLTRRHSPKRDRCTCETSGTGVASCAAPRTAYTTCDWLRSYRQRSSSKFVNVLQAKVAQKTANNLKSFNKFWSRSHRSETNYNPNNPVRRNSPLKMSLTVGALTN
jgi:hypothetical protein